MVEFLSSSKVLAQSPPRSEGTGAVSGERPFAIVTPTFWRDLARCELLAELVDRCAPNVPHYLIVDGPDRKTFAHLERGLRTIVESEFLLDRGFWRIPGKSGLWITHWTPP